MFISIEMLALRHERRLERTLGIAEEIESYQMPEGVKAHLDLEQLRDQSPRMQRALSYKSNIMPFEITNARTGSTESSVLVTPTPNVPFLSSTKRKDHSLRSAKEAEAQARIDAQNAIDAFNLGQGTMLEKIGNTPLVQLEDSLWAKLEGYNPGGSLKDRTLSSIVLNMLTNGELPQKGGTLCLVTSGSAGVSLLALHRCFQEIPEIDLDIVVVMPRAYAEKPIPSELIVAVDRDGIAPQERRLEDGSVVTNEDGSFRILLLDGVFLDVLAEAEGIAEEEGWTMLQQHFDDNSQMGHRSTALELLEQCPELTDVVCATGTGATAAGLRRFLPPEITVHSRPAESGTIDGLSNVRRYSNFCDPSLLEGYDNCVFDHEVAIRHQEELEAKYGVVSGPSSGATWWLAKQISDLANRNVAFICADGTLPAVFGEGKLQSEMKKRRRRLIDLSKFPEDKSERSTDSPYTPSPYGKPGQRMVRAASFASVENTHWTPYHSALTTPPPGAKVKKSSSGEHRRGLSSLVERKGGVQRRGMSTTNVPEYVDNLVLGGGPVGASTAWFLAENNPGMQEQGEIDERIVLVHDPKDKGAHEDWSRLARLSFDGPADEMELSKHAVELLELVEEVRSMQSGAPVVPVKPGMLFLASPGTNMERACKHGEANFGDDLFVRRSPDELEDIFPGNAFNLPSDTLCWTHPTGLCVSPIELSSAARKTAEAYGAELVEGRAQLDVVRGEGAEKEGMVRVTLASGDVYDTRRLYLFAGAQSKAIVDEAIARDPERNAALRVPEFDDTYITAISTVRYAHVNHPSNPAPGSGHVVPPITLGQLNIPDLVPFEANFSVVAEEYGDVLKTRLSGDVGTEVIETVAGLHKHWDHSQDEEMAKIYNHFFGTLFPFLECSKALDFNRCVTYRNHNPNLSGTSIMENVIGSGASSSTVLTTAGCFGVGVKFGPALGEAAAAHTYGNPLYEGMNVFRSAASGGDPRLDYDKEEAARNERAW